MKKYIPLLFWAFTVLIFPINSFSQQKLTDFEIRISKPTQVFMVSDTLGNLASVFQSNKQFEVNFIDPDFRMNGSAVIQKPKSDKVQQIIGALLKERFCYVYSYNKKTKALSCLEIKKTDGSSEFSTIKVLSAQEGFLRAFEMNGSFYFLIIPKHVNRIKVLKLDGKDLSEINYDIEMPSFYQALSKGNDMLNVQAESEVGIEDINFDLENNIKSAYPFKKLYHFDGKIYLTFDEPATTHLIVLDPGTQKADYRKLNFSLERGNNSNQKQGNSFIQQNRFFRASFSPEQLNISILNLDSMTLINSYNIYPDYDIQILNGPIVQEGGNSSFGDEKIIKRTDQYFKRIDRGTLAIAANKLDDNTYEMEVGSYEISYSGRPGGGFGNGPTISFGMGMGMGMGMGGFGMGPGMMGMGMGSPYGGFYPGSFYGFPGYYSYQPSVRLSITYFKSLLNSIDFKHLPDMAPTGTMKDKINDFEYRAFKNNVPDVMRITPYKSNLLLGYYQKTGKRFHLVEFRK